MNHAVLVCVILCAVASGIIVGFAATQDVRNAFPILDATLSERTLLMSDFFTLRGKIIRADTNPGTLTLELVDLYVDGEERLLRLAIDESTKVSGSIPNSLSQEIAVNVVNKTVYLDVLRQNNDTLLVKNISMEASL